MPKRFGMPLYIVAGLPQPVSQNAVASLRKSHDLPPALYIQAASKRNGPIYDRDSVLALLKATCEEIRRSDEDTQSLIQPRRIILLYIPDHTSHVLLDGFGLACFPIPIEVEDEKAHLLRKKTDFATQSLKKIIGSPIDKLQIAEIEISSKFRKTALLLPANNFIEESTGTPIGDWFRCLMNGTEDWEHAQARLYLSKLTRDDLPRITARRIWAYVDKRNLCFLPAEAREMHGIIREGAFSEDTASLRHLLNGKYRFGFPINNDGFHYDVQLKGGASLSRISFTCAINGSVSTKEAYVNIYPNDFIRI